MTEAEEVSSKSARGAASWVGEERRLETIAFLL